MLVSISVPVCAAAAGVSSVCAEVRVCVLDLKGRGMLSHLSCRRKTACLHGRASVELHRAGEEKRARTYGERGRAGMLKRVECDSGG